MDTLVMDKVEVTEVDKKKVKAEKKEFCKQLSLERLGETRLNHCGSLMFISKYTDSSNVEVQFSNGYIATKVSYDQFCRGHVKSPYDQSKFGHGFIGVGDHQVSVDGKLTKQYQSWSSMLERIYSKSYKKNKDKLAYENCNVANEWLNFQNFAKWFDENYYEVDGQLMNLDKDILFPGNHMYSPDTCMFVPKNINTLFIRSYARDNGLPIGVSLSPQGKYIAKCGVGSLNGTKKKVENLGTFDTPEEAFAIYKDYKEAHIKKIAGQYKSVIPQRLYDILYAYVVIDDIR